MLMFLLVVDESIVPSASESVEERAILPLILGEQLENPFSVENMQLALDLIMNTDSETLSKAGVSEGVAEVIEIKATDLYVRFLPLDSFSHIYLTQDTSLTLFDFPLDYEIEQQGDYYEDVVEGSDYQWLYTTVKPDFIAPEGVRFEVLSELFIPENSEHYSEEIISSEPGEQTRSSGLQVMDDNFVNTLIVASFDLTGNAEELMGDDDEQVVDTKLTRYETIYYRFLWRRWTKRKAIYYPDGYIRVNTPSGNVGLKNVKVTMRCWFYYSSAYTNSNGYYRSRGLSRSGNNLDYSVHFEGYNRSNRWSMDKTLVQAVCLWTNRYNAGKHHPNGHSMTFYASSDFWGKCVIHNAIYDYVNIARKDGISLPPSYLRVANEKSSDFTASAPLLGHHQNVSLIYGAEGPGTVATVLGYTLFGWLLPDLILKYDNRMSKYNAIVTTVWHELTHASQLQRLKSEIGYSQASTYWSRNVYQQAKNSMDSGRPYGTKGGLRWEQIAITEGWGKFREWKLGMRELQYNVLPLYYNSTNHSKFSDYSGYPDSYNLYYAGMFEKLYNAGCSYRNLEKSTATYSIAGFKQNILRLHPERVAIINSIMIDYV